MNLLLPKILFCSLFSLNVFASMGGYRWTRWGEWSQCPVTCGRGEITRVRKCIGGDREPVEDANCRGSARATRQCRMFCVKDLEWANWSSWSDCSATCESGIETRTDVCVEMPVSLGRRRTRERNSTCPYMGSERNETRPCVLGECPPVDGGWSNWNAITGCSACLDNELGDYTEDTRMEFRQCTEPSPSHGGIWCQGTPMRKNNCFFDDCPVWSEWGNWSDCSSNCTSEKYPAYKIRRRECIKLPGSFPAEQCDGDDFEEEDCTGLPACPDIDYDVTEPPKNCSTYGEYDGDDYVDYGCYYYDPSAYEYDNYPEQDYDNDEDDDDD